MSLSGTVPELSDAERAREPRSLGLVAWFDGWGQSQGMPPATFPRRLDPAETAEWREGFAEGKAATAEWEARCREPAPKAMVAATGTPTAPAPPEGFAVTRNGTRWACAACGVVGLPDTPWMEPHRRGHTSCPDCGKPLTVKPDGSARQHTRCPRRR